MADLNWQMYIITLNRQRVQSAFTLIFRRTFCHITVVILSRGLDFLMLTAICMRTVQIINNILEWVPDKIIKPIGNTEKLIRIKNTPGFHSFIDFRFWFCLRRGCFFVVIVFSCSGIIALILPWMSLKRQVTIPEWCFL